jgi:hypothetical protein
MAALDVAPDPSEIMRMVRAHDPTYRLAFGEALRELALRYDVGRWWIRGTGVRAKGGREVCFTNRERDPWLTRQYFHWQDVRAELRSRRQRGVVI